MKIGIRNNKDTTHTICSVQSGARFIITPHNFIIIDTHDEREINYWTNLKPEILDKIGISVFVEDEISKLQSSQCQPIYYSVQDVCENINLGSIVRDIPEQQEQPEQSNDTAQTEPKDSLTEESLLQMEKDDLFIICDKLNIKYKKNNSKQTLVNLILGSGLS